MHSSKYIEENAHIYPDVYAIKSEYGHLTYSQLDTQVNKLSNNLLMRGLNRGDKVILFMPNTLELIVSYLAVQKIGAIPVPLDIKSTSTEVKRCIEHVHPAAFIVHDLIFHKINDLATPMLKIKTGKGNLYWESFREIIFTATAAPVAFSVNENDLASLLFRSNKFESPRTIMLRYGSLLPIAHQLCANLEIKQTSRIILMMPLNHLLSFQLFVMASIISGATLILRASFTPELLIEAVESEQATHFFGTTDFYLSTGIKLQNKAADLSSMRWWIYEGDSITTYETDFIKKQFETDHFFSINRLTEDDGEM